MPINSLIDRLRAESVIALTPFLDPDEAVDLDISLSTISVHDHDDDDDEPCDGEFHLNQIITVSFRIPLKITHTNGEHKMLTASSVFGIDSACDHNFIDAVMETWRQADELRHFHNTVDNLDSELEEMAEDFGSD